MQWHPWNDAAFARARERGTPVLCVLTAPWCRFSAQLTSGPLRDPRVLALLQERYVGIAISKDERPDVDQLVRGSGWPTLAWLTPDGEVYAQRGLLTADELIAELESLAQPKQDEGPRARAARARDERLSLSLVDEVVATLKETADPDYGGWGRRQKFPHPEALHLLIVRWSQTGDPDTLRVVRNTLQHMQDGEVYDRVEGGFFRYARKADWSEPHHQKVLASNALRLLAYVEAHQALGEPSYRQTAEGILEWMHGTLLDPQTRAFRGSQDADSEYFHLATPEARARRGAPDCDPRIYTDRNAHAVCALLKAGLVLEREDLLQQAEETLGFLMRELWDERVGMHHYWDGTYNIAGLLMDQAATLRALVESMHYAGDGRWMEPALTLARTTLEQLSAEDGSLYDRRHDKTPQGALRERSESILANAVFGEALLRVGHMAREDTLVQRAEEILAAFAGDHRRYGHFVAGYGRAVDLLFHPPVHVTVVGPADSDRTRELRKAALRPYVASRIVQTLDPATDGEWLERAGLEGLAADSLPRAFVQQGDESYAETGDPGRLAALMTRAERSS